MPSRRRFIAVVCCCSVAGSISACGRAARGDGARPLVVATTTQLADFARQVGGERVEVRQLLQPNTDPHEYEPRPRDVLAVADADLILTSGLGLDHWIGDLIDDAGAKARVVDVGAAVVVPSTGGAGADRDPHWWHDPRNAEVAAGAIARALVAVDPAGAAVLRRRARSYQAQVRALDAGIGACIRAIPRAERRIVTDHDAFGFFARRYGVRIVGALIPSQSTQAQASAGDLAALERTIRRERVRAIFPEASVNAKLARRIARDTGATARLTLYGDTLGPRDGPAGTYLGMESANARALVSGITAGRRSCALGMR